MNQQVSQPAMHPDANGFENKRIYVFNVKKLMNAESGQIHIRKIDVKNLQVKNISTDNLY